MDDVDLTILSATSVLGDLIDKCPPAEACRDAFERMNKATIAMCLNTTGFGKVTTLGSMPVETPGSSTVSPVGIDGYFSPVSTTSQPGHKRASSSKRTLPSFDMNLSDLFPDGQLAHRPPQHSPPVQSGNQRATTSPQATYRITNTQQYAPLADSISQAQPELSFENCEFLDSFVVDGPNSQLWGNELDLGFGTGGTAGSYDDSVWDNVDGLASNNGGVDLFGGLFFGHGTA